MLITAQPNGSIEIRTTINNETFKRVYYGYSRNEAKQRFIAEFNQVCNDGRYNGMTYNN